MSSVKLATLNASLTKLEPKQFSLVPLGHEAADLCLNGGLKRGALHEVFAATGYEAAAAGFAAGLTVRAAMGKRVLWICQDFSAREFGELSATGILEFGLDPACLLLFRADSAADALKAAHDALSCAVLGAVVLEIPGNPKILDLTASRKLTLAAGRTNITVCLLRFTAKVSASAAETRWLVRGVPSPVHREDWGQPAFDVDLVRNRQGRTGQWVMEWSCDHGLFQPAAPHFGAMVSAPSNRQAATAEEDVFQACA